MAWRCISFIIAAPTSLYGIIEEAPDITLYIMEARPAIYAVTSVLREPQAARRGATASPSNYCSLSFVYIMVQTVKL